MDKLDSYFSSLTSSDLRRNCFITLFFAGRSRFKEVYALFRKAGGVKMSRFENPQELITYYRGLING